MKYHLLLTIITFIFTKTLKRRTRGTTYFTADVKFSFFSVNLFKEEERITLSDIHTESLLILFFNPMKGFLLNLFLLTRHDDPQFELTLDQKRISTIEGLHIDTSLYIINEFNDVVCDLKLLQCVKLEDLKQGIFKVYEFVRREEDYESQYKIAKSSEDYGFIGLGEEFSKAYQGIRRDEIIDGLIKSLLPVQDNAILPKRKAQVDNKTNSNTKANISLKPTKSTSPPRTTRKQKRTKRKIVKDTKIVQNDRFEKVPDDIVIIQNTASPGINGGNQLFPDELYELMSLLLTSDNKKTIKAGAGIFKILHKQKKLPNSFYEFIGMEIPYDESIYYQIFGKILTKLRELFESEIKKRDGPLKEMYKGLTLLNMDVLESGIQETHDSLDLLINKIITDFQLISKDKKFDQEAVGKSLIHYYSKQLSELTEPFGVTELYNILTKMFEEKLNLATDSVSYIQRFNQQYDRLLYDYLVKSYIKGSINIFKPKREFEEDVLYKNALSDIKDYNTGLENVMKTIVEEKKKSKWSQSLNNLSFPLRKLE
jgi:hypothetical protein